MTDELQAAEAEARPRAARDFERWVSEVAAAVPVGDNIPARLSVMVALREARERGRSEERATEAARSRGEKKEITEEMVDRALEGWFHGLGGDWREVAPLPQTQADLRSRARAALSAALAVIADEEGERDRAWADGYEAGRQIEREYGQPEALRAAAREVERLAKRALEAMYFTLDDDRNYHSVYNDKPIAANAFESLRPAVARLGAALDAAPVVEAPVGNLAQAEADWLSALEREYNEWRTEADTSQYRAWDWFVAGASLRENIKRPAAPSFTEADGGNTG